MKKLALLFILWAIPSLGQSHNFPALDTTNVYTGTNIFNGPVNFGSGFVTSGSITAPQFISTGTGFLIGPFKTQTAPGVPQSGFMECYGDSGTNKFACLNPDGSNAMPSAGSSLTINTNGSANSSQTLLNFVNPPAFNGLTFTYSNPGGAGNETFTLGGSLGNAGLTNPSMTLNGTPVTLGGTYSIAGSAPGSVTGSSDTITATVGTFATQYTLTSAATLVEVRAHGVYTTGATASPVMNLQVNIGGTSGACQHASNNALSINQTNLPWDIVCYFHIATTGTSGTAIPWGLEEASTAPGGALISKTLCNASPCTAATIPFNTVTSTVSIQETTALVSGESMTLQTLDVRSY